MKTDKGTVGIQAAGDRSLGYRQEADEGVSSRKDGNWADSWLTISPEHSQGPEVGGFPGEVEEGRPLKGRLQFRALGLLNEHNPYFNP